MFMDDFTTDNMGQLAGLNQMNFDQRGVPMGGNGPYNAQRMGQNGGIRPLVQSGGAAASVRPAEVTMRDCTISPNNVVIFAGHKHFLSNMFDSPIRIEENSYPSVEHYYEACKLYQLAGPYQAMNLKGCRNAFQVKKMSKRIRQHEQISRRDVEMWKSKQGLAIARVAILEKFRQNANLRNKLFGTGNKLLVQANKFDKNWAVGMDYKEFKEWLQSNGGTTVTFPSLVQASTVRQFPEIANGKNLLGHLIMYCRELLRAEFGVPYDPSALLEFPAEEKAMEEDANIERKPRTQFSRDRDQ